jgi:hypothetical protein
MRILPVIFFLSITFLCNGQSGVPLYPDVFSGFFLIPSSVNPSYVPEEGNVNLAAYYKFRAGALSDVNSFLFMGEKIFRGEEAMTHAGRILVFNEREGPYISKPRGYFNYALELALAKEAFLNAGISLGFSSVNFSAPSASGSVFLPDGSLAVGFKVKNISASVVSAQVFNTEGVAASSAVRLARYYNFILSGEKELSPFWKINISAYWRKLPELNDQWYFSGLLQYHETLQAGIIYKYERGLSFPVKLGLNRNGNPLFISFIYNTGYLSKIPLWNNSYEIGIQYGVQ